MKCSDLKYLLAYLGPLTAYISIFGSGLWCYSAVIAGFIIIPLLDIIIPVNRTSIHENTNTRVLSTYFDVLLYFNIPIVYGLLICFFIRAQAGNLSSFELTGMLLSLGLYVSTSGVNVAHELGHRSDKVNKFLAKILLIPALYLHYYIAHNRGHHKTVATYDDPASARYGEHFYGFLFRSAIGEYISAWNLENKRLLKEKKQNISFSNQMIVFSALQLAFLLLIYFLWGFDSVLYMLLIALISNVIVQAINYIEHYGLVRHKGKDGGFERIQFKHSWNSSHAIGRIFLYELTRHSDHHYKASKKYQILEHPSGCPELPTGYPGSMILALFPPLWFRIMNSRIPAEMTNLR